MRIRSDPRVGGGPTATSSLSVNGRRRYGKLWSVEVLDDEQLVMVECVCPSTDRVYMLRVPPSTRSAREGLAWTFGYDDPQEYELSVAT